MKTIFALDSSGRSAGVCVLSGDAVCFEKTLCEGLTHSETLLALADEAFRETGFTPRDIDVYGVAAGPGSFTGLRIGLALIKGLALPINTPVAPVSTLEALALDTPFPGVVVAALDARRGEVYWAAFDGEAGGARLSPDRASSACEIDPVVAAFGRPVIFVGDGAEMCYTNCSYGCIVSGPLAEQPHIARGAALAASRMWQEGRVCAPAHARADYLRLSQAERERRAKHADGKQEKERN